MAQQPVLSYGAPVHASRDLPVRPPDRLFGRDAAFTSIHQMLKAGTAVLLYGPMGIGKTAAAAALATSYAELPGGVLWFDLLRDTTSGILQRVAHAYGLTRPADAIVKLQDQRPLVVLDGELNEDAAREFARQTVGIPLLLIHTGFVPGPWTPVELSALPDDDALAMLVHQAGEAGEAEDIQPLREILLGHPFSIVVAARQLVAAKVSPTDFLSKILAGESNPAMGVLMGAYRLLPSTLQGMVLLLGAGLGGGASEELLSDVGGAPAQAIRAAMRQLVTRGFATERVVYDQPYFSVHELVQAFAQNILRSKNQLEAMQNRHLKGIVTYVRRHFAENSAEHRQRMAAEMHSILAAGLYAAQHNQLDQLTTLTQLLTPTSGDGFVPAFGLQAELEWLNYLVEHPEAAANGVLAMPVPVEAEVEPLPEIVAPELDVQEQDTMAAPPVTDFALALDEAEQPAPPSLPEAKMEEAQPLYERGQAAAKLGNRAEAITYYQQALESYEANGQVDDELAALEALAQLSLEQDQVTEALNYVDKGMKLAEQTNDPQREGHLLMVLGDLQSMLRRDAGAELAYQEAIRALRPTEAWFDIGTVLDKLGTLYLDQQRYQDAVEVLTQAVAIFERFQRNDYLVGVYDKLGDSYASLLQWNEAKTNHVRSLELAQQTGDQQKFFAQLAQLALTLESSGHPDEARPYYQRALAQAFEMEDREKQGYMLLALGELLIDETPQLNRVVQFLEGADERLVDNVDAQRLLSRAKTRQQRLNKAGGDLLPPEASLEAYARTAIV